jgi:acyl transferase domain-containing protein
MNPPETQGNSVAIVGLAGRWPGAKNPEEFWRQLREGVESVSFFKDEELQWSPLDGPLPNQEPNLVKARAVLENPDRFDAAFFNIDPQEAEVMDPQHRVFLECAWEALENAGCNPDAYDGLIGLFAGTSMNTYLLANVLTNRQPIHQLGGFRTMLASDKDYLATRVAYTLNLRGPGLNIQTACSTSLVAVCIACQNLLNFQCDMALAGGVSITVPQKRAQPYREGGIYSPDGHCRTFDAQAAGTVSGDGVGIVALKRLSDALADGDRICAVIKGCAINNDGSLKAGYTTPSMDGQAEVIAMAQANAGVNPDSISYIEANGTGTPLADPIELGGLTKAFRVGTTANGFCAIGSVKSNVGHLDAAAGVTGLIKTVLALQHQQLPASLHFRRPNPKIDFANSPFYVNNRLREWKSGRTPRRAGVNSFGIGGTNAHVVLEEAPQAEPSSESRRWQLLVISATTESALETATANLAAHLRQNPKINLADAAFTLQVGRKPFGHRRMVVCQGATDAEQVLSAGDPKRLFKEQPTTIAPPVGFLFPGQGAQQINMTRGLYESEAVFHDQLNRCCESLEPHLELDLRNVLYPDAGRMEESAKLLTQTSIVQSALFVVEYALARLWMSWGIRPQAMLGHGVGEYVAACLAGVFSLADALALVAARGRLTQSQPPGAMVAIRLPESEVKTLLGRKNSLAAINGPSLCVASGPFDAIEALEKKLVERGVPGQRLSASHAFHSEMMDSVLHAFAAKVRKTKLNSPQLPYLSNVTGKWATDQEATDPHYWAAHLRQTVRFADGLSHLAQPQNGILLEVGPGQSLSDLARQHPIAGAGHTIVSSLEQPEEPLLDQPSMLNALGRLWLSGVTVDWAGFYAHERRHRLSLPTYPFERQRYWIEPGPLESSAGSAPMNPPDCTASSAPQANPVQQQIHSLGDPAQSERRECSILSGLKVILQEASGADLWPTNASATAAPFPSRCQRPLTRNSGT